MSKRYQSRLSASPHLAVKGPLPPAPLSAVSRIVKSAKTRPSVAKQRRRGASRSATIVAVQFAFSRCALRTFRIFRASRSRIRRASTSRSHASSVSIHRLAPSRPAAMLTLTLGIRRQLAAAFACKFEFSPPGAPQGLDPHSVNHSR